MATREYVERVSGTIFINTMIIEDKNFRKKLLKLIGFFIIFAVLLSSCVRRGSEQIPYGVFLSYTGELEQLADYQAVVIDAQYYSVEDIKSFRKKGHTVYSYINVGSLENFRKYYKEYKDLALGGYEHWEEEVWIDVSDERWQNFIINNLAVQLLDKGIDGFFVDNCDVYYNFPTEENLEGLSVIMEYLISTGKKVLINGGDTFLDAYCNKGGSWRNVITGINQESVFSKILWGEDKFSSADEADQNYFSSYIERYGDQGAEIYLLEYTTDAGLIRKIKKYCMEKDYSCYISDSLGLDFD